MPSDEGTGTAEMDGWMGRALDFAGLGPPTDWHWHLHWRHRLNKTKESAVDMGWPLSNHARRTAPRTAGHMCKLPHQRLLAVQRALQLACTASTTAGGGRSGAETGTVASSPEQHHRRGRGQQRSLPQPSQACDVHKVAPALVCLRESKQTARELDPPPQLD